MPSDRYNRPFLLPEHLHCEGLPFEIEAGALLVDTTTNDALAQLKMLSHSDKSVKAVKVTLQPEDTRGEALGNPVVHQYLDLDVTRDESFGQKTPVPFPDQSSRSFSVVGVEVVYSDNSVASSKEGTWRQLPSQEALSATVTDEELIKQYHLEYGNECLYHLQELGDLWRCVCGTTNRSDEDACHKCGLHLDELKAIDIVALEGHKEKRLEEERLEREAELERERTAKEEAEEAAAKKKASNRKAAIIAAAVAAAAAIAFLVVNATIIPAGKYNDAVALMEAEDYAGAKEAFIALGEYRDSQTKIEECDEGLLKKAEATRGEIAELVKNGSYEQAQQLAVDTDPEDAETLYAQAERVVLTDASVGDTVSYGHMSSADYLGQPLEWQVLDKDDEGLLLLSKHVMAPSAYNDDRYGDDWTKVALRSLLQSGEGVDGLFSKPEQEGILRRERVYDGEYDESSKSYKPGTEKKCTDLLFSLSRADVEKYLPDAKSRQATTIDGVEQSWWLSDVYETSSNNGGYTSFLAVSNKDWSIGHAYESTTLWGRYAMWVAFE